MARTVNMGDPAFGIVYPLDRTKNLVIQIHCGRLA